MIQQIQKEIEQVKQKLDVAIMAHSYQGHEILEVADAVGDSFQLSKQAQACGQSRILLCGVHFMAETAKLLSPEKQVYLAHPGAVCPMAEQFTPEQILAEKEKYPGCKVVAYINTTAALKAVSDVCVTSSSAEQIVRNIDAEDILFIPDCNLGSYVQSRVPEKRIHLLSGGCPVHASVEPEDLAAARYCIRVWRFWCIRSAGRRSLPQRILPVQPLPSWRMPSNRTRMHLSSAPRSASRSTYSMPARTSSFMIYPKS